MNKLSTTEEIYGLMASSTASAALGTAIETGLLWSLAEKPSTAEEIIQSLKIPGKRGYYWLQYLESFGVLELGPEGYSPSNLIYEAILESKSQESWVYLTREERERTAGVYNLPKYLSEPGSIWTAQGFPARTSYVEKMRNSPEEAREFTRMLFEVHQNLANLLAEMLDLSNVHTLLDLGGGSGVVSMALLRKYPELTATVVDIENVCIAGRKIAQEQSLSDRISYYPAEFFKSEFPTGFDMAIQCDVGVSGLELYQKLFNSLIPGGRMIFAEHFSPTEDSAPETRLEWTFLDSLGNPDFFMPTLAQVKAQLTQVGFRVLPEQKILGRGLVVFEARR